MHHLVIISLKFIFQAIFLSKIAKQAFQLASWIVVRQFKTDLNDVFLLLAKFLQRAMSKC